MNDALEQELLPHKHYAPRSLGRVLVVGLGKSGMAVVQYCASLLGTRVESLVVSAGKQTDAALAFAESFQGTGIEFRFDYEDIEGSFDLCIVSPGVSDLSPLYQNAKAASTELIGELEFAWRESDEAATWVAITGTNGKTTTTSLVEHVLKQAGYKALAVGNIGEVALGVVKNNPQDIYVAEVSSFQLASMSRFAPEVVVLLNITPDHLYWHGTMERYIEAKKAILTRLNEVGATAILDCTNDIVAEIADEVESSLQQGRLVRMIDGEEYQSLLSAFADAKASGLIAPTAEKPYAVCAPHEGQLVIDAQADVISCGHIADLQIKGEHNVLNALAAATACTALGVSAEAVKAGLSTFAPLEHRIEPCGEVDGVAFFNDSKGTNVDATVKAFTAFTPGSIICLLGGTDKGTDLAPLVEAAQKTCKAVVCYGESGERFLEAFGATPDVAMSAKGVATPSGLVVFGAAGMREATRLAAAWAKPGDAVLLSPACASFDEFTSFEHRGSVFKDLVKTELMHHGN